MSSTTSPPSAPNNISLLKAELAQPCGVSFASVCIQSGVMNSGHQQPPTGASTSDASTAAEVALACVRTRAASITPKAAEVSTMSTETSMTAAGEKPRSIRKATSPTPQSTASCIAPR